MLIDSNRISPAEHDGLGHGTWSPVVAQGPQVYEELVALTGIEPVSTHPDRSELVVNS